MQPTRNMPERWKPVVGFEGIYEVSDQGGVRSIDRTIVCKDGRYIPAKGKMLAPFEDRHGYLRATLSRDGRSRKYFVHRLVLDAFVGPKQDGEETRHLDGDRANNFLCNLEYGTGSQNTLDKVKHGTHLQASRTHCPHGHLLEEPNLVKSQKALGWRSCLACARGRSYVSRNPHLAPQVKEICDRYHEEILSLGGAA